MIIVEESSDLCNYHKFSSSHHLAYAQDASDRASIHRISIANYFPVKSMHSHTPPSPLPMNDLLEDFNGRIVHESAYSNTVRKFVHK